MTLNINRYLNRTVLVSIPALSKNGQCRPYKLTGIELIGLWLESEELAHSFLADEHRSRTSMSWQFFVPFSQIACVAVGTPAATPSVVNTGTGQAKERSTLPAAADGAAAKKKPPRK